MTRPTLFKKILAAMLLLSLLPLLVSAFILAMNLGSVRDTLADRIASSADQQASDSLRQRAEQVAENISVFLHECESDVRLLAVLPKTLDIIHSFYRNRQDEIWYRAGTAAKPKEIREWVPRYSSLAVIDRYGRETLVIKDGKTVNGSQLRDVSNPANTDYKREE